VVFQNNLLMGAAGQSAVAYIIDESCRFNDDDSSQLTWTPGQAQSNADIGTISFWMKLGNLGIVRQIYNAGAGVEIQLNASDQMVFSADGSTSYITTQLFRDPAAWYHIVWNWNTGGPDIDLYVNGVEVTAFGTSTDPSAGVDFSFFKNGQAQTVAANESDAEEFDGYLAEFAGIDGTQYAASNFGKTDSTTGQWIPKNISGLTFGTNGFLLAFQDSSALGDDTSGNGNDFTSSGLTAADQMTTSPTSNEAVLNPLNSGSTHTLSDGNLTCTSSAATSWNRTAAAQSLLVKTYWEVAVGSYDALCIGIQSLSNSVAGTASPVGEAGAAVLLNETTVSGSFVAESGAAITFPMANGQYIMMAYDPARAAIWYGNNGTWYDGSGSSASSADILAEIVGSGTTSAIFTSIASEPIPMYGTYRANAVTFRFSAAQWGGSLPTGYSALNTSTIATPAIEDTSAYFQSTLYEGNSSTQSIDQGGNSTFTPDFVWIKNRDATDAHALFDVVRGVTKVISSDAATAEAANDDTLTAFESDGFALGDDVIVNTNAESYVAWQWKVGGSGSSNSDGSIGSTVSANTTSGFSIVKYTGTGANGTVGHGLGVIPRMILIKDTTNAESWIVYSAGVGNDGNLYLNLTNSKATSAIFQDTTPTSSVFSLGTTDGVNKASGVHIAYCFNSVPGYSSMGSYEGNGAANGSFIYTGFSPSFVMCKSVDSTSDWYMYDSKRLGYNVDNNALLANTTGVELTADNIDILSNGFKMRIASDPNVAETYIYMAFGSPFGGENIAPATAR